MTEQEYYELPYGVGDRLENQRLLIADHHYGMEKEIQRHKAQALFETENYRSDTDKLVSAAIVCLA